MTEPRRATRAAGPPTSQLPWRQSDAELRRMARDWVTGQAVITSDEQEIRSAFYVMTAMLDWSTVDVDNVGAFYGPMDSTIPGRAMNGLPIFTSMRLVHLADMPALRRHVKQMRAALA